MSPGPLVVLGDALLDVDVRGTATRFTADGAVPVIDCAQRRERPGGAGLAALLAAVAGDRDVVLVTGLGDDEPGSRVAAMLDGVVETITLPLRGGTPQKTRVLAGHRAVLRLDCGSGRVGSDTSLPARARTAMRGAGAVLVADYGRGMATHPEVTALLPELAVKLPIAWDPHPRGGRPLPGMRLVMPNQAEAAAFAAVTVHTGHDATSRATRHATQLLRAWGVSGVAVTLGASGAVLATAADAPVVARAPEVAATDTCGAGDSFAATVARALADGLPLADTVALAVHAAAAFVAAGAAREVNTGKGTATWRTALRERC